MNRTFKIFTLILVLLSLSLSFTYANAHEGHAHHGGIQALYGGVIKEGKTLNVELVALGKTIKLYPISKDGKPLSPKDMNMSATAQPPRKNITMVDLKAVGDHFEGTVDAKGAYRYELRVKVVTSDQKKKKPVNNFIFQVEP